MAEQDFARITAQVEVLRPEDVRPISSGRIVMLAVALLIIVAGSFVGGYKFGYQAGEQGAQSESKARLVARLEEQGRELERLREEAEKRLPDVSTTQVGELTFYNELPKQSVEPSPLSESEASNDVVNPVAKASEPEALLQQIIEAELKQSPVAVQPSSQQVAVDTAPFYVQAASFRKEADARVFAGKLQTAAIKASVERAELLNLGTRYRVFVGPFASREAAAEANVTLKSKMNISGLVVRRDR